MALDEASRLREEDPNAGGWTTSAPTRCVVLRSRFEVDLNRARLRAVYRTPPDAWGLQVWKRPMPEDLVRGSLALYDSFYAAMTAAERGADRLDQGRIGSNFDNVEMSTL